MPRAEKQAPAVAAYLSPEAQPSIEHGNSGHVPHSHPGALFLPMLTTEGTRQHKGLPCRPLAPGSALAPSRQQGRDREQAGGGM